MKDSLVSESGGAAAAAGSVIPILRDPDMRNDALMGQPPTAVHVPGGARKAVAALLLDLVAQAVGHTDSGSTDGLPLGFALRWVLPAGATSEEMIRRSALARRGEWATLAALPAPRRGGRAFRTGPDTGPQRARALMNAGNMRKALNALDNTPCRLTDLEYEVEVRRLFPSEPPMTPDAVPAVGAAEEALTAYLQENSLSMEGAVYSAIRSFRPLSQPGPSGLRAEHLLLAWKEDQRFGPMFSALIRMIITGRFSGDAVSGSTLSMVAKETGGHRPIGVGEVLRRIAGKIVMNALTPRVRGEFEQANQYVLSRFGTAIAYRRVVRAAEAAQWVLQVDLKNAFNEVLRQAVFRAAPDEPILCPIMRSLYATPSVMYMPKIRRSILAKRGVVQGCPLGPALFASALQPIIHAAGEGLDVSQTWYADDGHVSAACPEVLEVYLERLIRLTREVGLTLSPGHMKTKVLAPDPAVLIPDSCPNLRRMTTVSTLTALGGPVVAARHPSRSSAIADAWESLRLKVERRLSPLKRMLDPQHVVMVLASAGSWSRVQYHAAARPEPIPSDFALSLEKFDLSLLALALGPHGRHLGEGENMGWLRATLPRSMGGLGIAACTVEAMLSKTHDSLILDALEAGNLDDVKVLREGRCAARTVIHEGRIATIGRNLSFPARNLFLDLRNGSGSAVLGVHPTLQDGTLLERSLAHTFLALYIGVPVLDEQQECPVCKRGSSDVYGSHYAGCSMMVTQRHDRVRDLIFGILRKALPRGCVVAEMSVGEDGTPVPSVDGLRPVDVGFRDPSSGNWRLFDITIVSTAPPATSPPPRVGGSGAPVGRSGSRPQERGCGSLLAHAGYTSKRAELDRSGFPHVDPLSFGAYGGIQYATKRGLGDICSALHNVGVKMEMRTLLGRVQFCLWRSLAIAINRRRCRADTRVVMAGLSRRAPERQGPWRGRSKTTTLKAIEPPPRVRLESSEDVEREQQCARSPDPKPAARKRIAPWAVEGMSRDTPERRAQTVAYTAALWAASILMTPPAERSISCPSDIELIRLAGNTCSALFTDWESIVREVADRVRVVAPDEPTERFGPGTKLSFDYCGALLGLHLPSRPCPLTRLRAWVGSVTSSFNEPCCRTFLEKGSAILNDLRLTVENLQPRTRCASSASSQTASSDELASPPPDRPAAPAAAANPLQICPFRQRSPPRKRCAPSGPQQSQSTAILPTCEVALTHEMPCAVSASSASLFSTSGSCRGCLRSQGVGLCECKRP